jgi:hypothetical protein
MKRATLIAEKVEAPRQGKVEKKTGPVHMKRASPMPTGVRGANTSKHPLLTNRRASVDWAPVSCLLDGSIWLAERTAQRATGGCLRLVFSRCEFLRNDLSVRVRQVLGPKVEGQLVERTV